MSAASRSEPRRLSRAGKTWLAAVATDPCLDREALLVAAWLAEHADGDGLIRDTEINRVIKEAGQ